jgi:glutathione S-transferase
MPIDPARRANIRIWIDYCNSRVQRAAGFIAHNYQVEQSARDLRQHLVTLNEHMNGRDYIDDSYSLGDITYIPFFARLERYQASIDTLTHIKAWMERLLSRPAVRATS